MKIYDKIVIDMETGKVLDEISYKYNGPVLHFGGGGGGGGDQTTTVRYAPYVEVKHDSFLTTLHNYRAALTDSSPFSTFTNLVIESAFFGSGYSIASFPSLYDMYGKFLAGLDIDTLYDQIFEDTVNASEVTDLVAAERDLLDDDIEQNILPRFKTGLRDINSVMSSSFIVGKSIIESSRVKSIAKFSAELRYRLIPVAAERWRTHLEWNKSVIMVYAEIMKLYYAAKIDVEEFNFTMAAKDTLWPFTVLEYERAGLGALQAAQTTEKDVAGSSKAQRALAGAFAGMAAGASTGNPAIATIGGLIGLASGLF